MRVYGMQVNHIARPLGFDLTPLRFSYKVACEGGKRQQSARVRVYGPDESVVYDSGTRQDIDSLCFAPDIPLSPRTRYTWDVTVTADTGETALSPRAWFETAKLQEPWLGQWIAAPREIANARLVKRFALPGRAPRGCISAVWGCTRPLSTARRQATNTWPPAATNTTAGCNIKPTM